MTGPEHTFADCILVTFDLILDGCKNGPDELHQGDNERSHCHCPQVVAHQVIETCEDRVTQVTFIPDSKTHSIWLRNTYRIFVGLLGTVQL